MMVFLRHEFHEKEKSVEMPGSASSPSLPGEKYKGVRPFSWKEDPTVALGLRAKQLKDLKKRWLLIGEKLPGENSIDDLMYRNKLSKESARLLLCSEEAIELIKFLEKEQVYNSVETEVEKLFESALAGEARQILVSLPDETSDNGTNYRELLSRPAGRGCPPEEFGEFCSALENPICVQEATFGHNVVLAKTDPIGALTSTLCQIDMRADSRTKNSSLRVLIQALPPGADFEQVDRLIPDSEPEDPLSPFRGIKSSFVQAWSKVDPTAAAAYFMAHPEKFPVSDIQIPTEEALTRNLESGIEWIQTFPEGPYFDVGAGIAVTLLINNGNPKEAHQLAAQIGNPATRKVTMEAALKPPLRYTEND